MPGGEVHLEPPPELPRSIPGNVLMKVMPIVMIGGSVLMMGAMFMIPGRPNPMMLMMGGMTVLGTLGMMSGGMGGRSGPSPAEMNEERKDYLRYLSQMRERARAAAEEQRRVMEWSHPAPSLLWAFPRTRRMWERRPTDSDFCHLRIGQGSQRLITRLVPPQTGPVEELEPIVMSALRRFVRAHSIVSGLPVAISLRGFAVIALSGERERVRALTRAMIAQLAVFHTPDDVLVAVVAAGRARERWEWVKWLPHAQHPTEMDGIGQRRIMAGSLAQVETILREVIGDRPKFNRTVTPSGDEPHVVIILDDPDISGDENILMMDGLHGVTLIDLCDSVNKLSARRGLRVLIEDDRLGAKGNTGVEWFGSPDAISIAEAEALARRLAPFRTSVHETAEEQEPLSANPNILELCGVPGDPMTFDIQQAWRPRPIRERFSVPFGIGETGEPVTLDIKEAAEAGMGPHGLCIGATGSGKSEFLRTLVLGMMCQHSSAQLNFILVDFKGGATFLGLDVAPHVAATITNLQGDLTMVDRMRDALDGEMNRRQQLLADANAKNVWDYEAKREAGADLAPLPALFIVVDEFSEMLQAKPDFIDLFNAIGRLGRSLQMHMLLATQRLEEGKLRGLDAHLRYRIGLKTFSAAESRAAIGVPDAFELPPVPGSGYLKADGQMIRFKAAYVSGPHRPSGVRNAGVAAPITSDKRPRFFVPDFIELPPEPATPVVEVSKEKVEREKEQPEESELDVIVKRLRGQGPEAHQVWLPPLERPEALDPRFPPLVVTEDRGLCPVGFHANGRLAVPIGSVDKPYEQRRDELWADLSGGQGNLVCVGGPQSGKSMLLRTFVMAMALTHTPEEVQFYCLDFGGGGLRTLAGLPHVGSTSGRLDPDRVRRTISELTSLLTEREARFRDLGIDSVNTFRTRKRRGEIPDDQFGDVFLVIDGWLLFKQEFETLEQQVVNLATQGLSFGIHVAISANRWAEMRPALKDMLGTRFELRLGDPSESEVDRRQAVNVPQGRPGRGMTSDKLHFLVWLPRIDSAKFGEAGVRADDVSEGIQDAVAQIASAWKGARAPSVRMLPDELPYELLPAPARPVPAHWIPLGANEEELAPVHLDFTADPHFVAFADTECGKTNLLRVIIKGIVDRYTPKQARILLVDYRRTMLGFVPQEHLMAYAAAAQQLTGFVGDVRKVMNRRLPGPDVTQEQLKNRSWWSGAECFVIVDDYDLVATQSGNPLQPLAEFLPQAKDVGFHLIVVRRSGGSARASFDPVIGKLRELAVPGLVMSGNKDEGALVGTTRPAQMPPGRGNLVTRKRGVELIQVAWIRPE